VVGRPLDDRELVARARRGDADAYEELVLAYQGIALRTAYLFSGNAADAAYGSKGQDLASVAREEGRQVLAAAGAQLLPVPRADEEHQDQHQSE